MTRGHFHLHTGAVQRAKGHSAVAAAAYQAGQSLLHQQQRRFSLPIDHRKSLNKGALSSDLRQAFAANGIELSEQATAQKEGRREWTISDGGHAYQVKEFERKVTNKKTGKRETAGRALDVYADKLHTYTTREDVVETWIQASAHAPAWIRALEEQGAAIEKKSRQGLWNWAEAAEVARDGRPARKIQMAFSRDLSLEQNKALLRDYVAEHFTQKGLIADIAIHSKKASDGQANPHAHVLITTREVDAQGQFAATKNDYWNGRERVFEWRAAWADKVNAALEHSRKAARIDERSYAEQGVDVIPGAHMGASAWNRHQRGEATAEAARNADIERENTLRDNLFSRLGKRMQARSPEEDQAPAQTQPEPQKEHYAGKITVRRWFGLGSLKTTIYRPGLASLSRAERHKLEWEYNQVRLTPGEVHQRLETHHRQTLGGFLASQQSGGLPRDAVEHFQRMARLVRQKIEASGERLNHRFASWRERVDRYRETPGKNEPER